MKREPYSIKQVIENCAFWNNGNPNLDLLICKLCDRFWICENSKIGSVKNDGKNKMFKMW